MKNIIILTILTIVLYSCTDTRKHDELRGNYELTLDLLTTSIKRNGHIIERSRAKYPEKLTNYYSKWRTIDSLTADIEAFLTDSTDRYLITDFYQTKTKKIKNIQTTYYNFIDSSWSKNYQQARKKYDSMLSEQMKYPSIKEVENATFPKLFACNTLLANLQMLTRTIVGDISSDECFWGITWDCSGMNKGDTTIITMNSQNFYNIAKDGFFKIEKLVDSRGQIINEFDSRANSVIWTVAIPGQADSVYYLTGSIFSKHPVTGETVEIDTFQNKEIRINWR
jgi:hypothetical protein